MARPAILPTNLRHVRPVQPFPFPSSDPEWEMPESKRHKRLCALLYSILGDNYAAQHSMGSDQFVYFDAIHPKRCLAPDAFLKLGQPDDDFKSWATSERGVPEVCAEILSPSDTREKLTFRTKLSRYRALGTRELVCFDIDAPAGSRLRAWDRVGQALVERVVDHETTPCLTLGLHWVLSGADNLPVALRLARDPHGHDLLRTAQETERASRIEAEAEIERLRKLLAKRRKG